MKRCIVYALASLLFLACIWRLPAIIWWARWEYHWNYGGPNPAPALEEQLREYERRTGEKVHRGPAPD